MMEVGMPTVVSLLSVDGISKKLAEALATCLPEDQAEEILKL